MLLHPRHRTRESLVFSVALALCVLHALDDAFLHRQPGVPLGQHAVAAFAALLAGVAGFVAFPRVRPGLRATLAIGFGLPALVNGAMHVVHIHFDAMSGSDLTGVAAAGAGMVLVGLGVSIPWRHRGAGLATPRRRWANRVLSVPFAVVVGLVVVVPIAMAIAETHKPRERVGDPPSAAYRNVSFDSSDGLRLKGWYRPSRNGATILLVHGGGGDRTGAVDQARVLERHGYGVLLYDARGRGESEGSPNSYGWDWEKDAAGALDFLHMRTSGPIGALGLSSGGDTVLDLAASHHDVGAVVAEGAAERTFDDIRNIGDTEPTTVTAWVMFKAIGAMTGDRPSRTLEDLVPRITSPLLLISAGTSLEKHANDRFARIANAPFEHWNVPGASHTGAVRSHPDAYRRHVTAFFDHALLAR